ncbi:molybdenum cofactor guanylyltransferase MobA [Comamonas endophytica]|uniref:Molybdenum cofactor guanylyltransferase MobA n=2 Tax=Comamonas endophytica TaxID=2949090 RepID=A0ABY6GFF6_9BURK|nr:MULTISPECIES: molybdenum cofactor guanylyltransferase MobA [unclassified Acidovorax]MCD2513857.1 molybdenum cofactor guanylyltransferase MobA [Acidovorax sp. D4N7]UYG53237.1 molybdenum cofactor guanylyltransferase MobA [Acidovorax sp. 5MLIR]
MGGADKGLQPFRGVPLALHALQRLAPQVGGCMLNANRNLAQYAAFGVSVWPDSLVEYPGPLAGFLCGLEHCGTPWLLTVPCDTPLFPHNLAERLARAAAAEAAEIVFAAGAETDARGEVRWRDQPVFCLLQAALAPSLQRYLAEGGRKIDHWARMHRCISVAFDRPADDTRAFANANTLQELHALEHAR